MQFIKDSQTHFKSHLGWFITSNKKTKINFGEIETSLQSTSLKSSTNDRYKEELWYC